MTRDDTIRLLAIMKAAYPSAFRGMSRETAEAMLALWADELAPYPPDLVTKAARELIRTGKFLPNISEMLYRVWAVAVDARARMICDAALGRSVSIAELERISAVAERLRPGASGAKALPASDTKRLGS
jgi:hypothetical protein